MKAKSFQEYLEKQLNKAEITEIEKLAKLELEFLMRSHLPKEKQRTYDNHHLHHQYPKRFI